MWVVSSIGITNTIGRIVCGAITSLPGVNALMINNIALTIGGIATIFSGFSLSLGFQFTYAIIFGIAIGKMVLLLFNFSFWFVVIGKVHEIELQKLNSRMNFSFSC